MLDKSLNLATMAELFADEDKARQFLEAKRWPHGAICPHCGCDKVYTLTPHADSNHPVRVGVYKCSQCRQQFTVRIGTIFEESKISLRKWLMAIHLMTSSKKGVSSHQIAREVGITVKSAWFLTQRIREAMRKEPMADMLKGTVEVDETYVGGKPRIKGISKRGRGTAKQPVMVLVERDGAGVQCKPIESISGRTLKGEIAKHVDYASVIMTDEFSAYKGIGKRYAGGHEVVNHNSGQYVRHTASGIKAHTNTAESFFALFKRGHYGIFHHLSKGHMHRYCTEFGFRWEWRHVTDGERFAAVIAGIEGKRLFYR